jgi:hypothetical protein
MRFMITAGPGEGPTSDAPPTAEQIADYMRFNEELYNAGVLVAAEGLNPGRQGAKLGVRNGKRTVLDGPYTETKELIGGFYVVEVASLDEAIEWARRCPLGLGTDNDLQIHPMTTMEDLPPEMVKLISDTAPNWFRSITEPRKNQK